MPIVYRSLGDAVALSSDAQKAKCRTDALKSGLSIAFLPIIAGAWLGPVGIAAGAALYYLPYYAGKMYGRRKKSR